MTRFCLTVVAGAVVTGVVVAAPRREKSGPAITPENVSRLRPAGGADREVWELAWGPGVGELAVVAWEKPLEVLDDTTFKPVRTLVGKKLVHFTFSRDYEKLAWCENNTRVVVENLPTGKKLVIDADQGQPSLAFSPDGKHLVVGGYGKEARMHDADTGKMVRAFGTDTDGGLTMVFSPDGKRMVLGNRNSDARIYEVDTGKLLHMLPKKMTHELKFNRSGDILAVAYVDGEVGLWDPATGKLLHSASTGAQETYSVDWSPKGDLLATSGREGQVIVWDPKGLKKLKELDAAEWVIKVRFSPAGDRLFAAGGTGTAGSPDRRLMTWTLPTR